MATATIAQLASATFKIEVEGSALADDVMRSMSYAVIEDCTNLPDMVSLSFHEPMTPGGTSLLEKTGVEIGKALKVKILSEQNTSGEDVFDGEVTAIETEFDAGKHWLIVRGFDKGSRLFRNPKTRTFVDMTYTDIVKKVAGEAGLSADTDATSGTYPHVYQAGQTDADFLSQLAAEVGYDLQVDRGKLQFKKPVAVTAADVELTLGDQLLRYNATLTADGQVENVEVHAWNTKEKKAEKGEATAATVTAKLDDGALKPDAIATKVGSTTYVTHAIPYANAEQAQAAAKALAELMGSSFAQVVGTSRGNPKIKAGAAVKLVQIEKKFEGMHRVTKSRHVFDNGEYLTQFECTGRRELSLHTLAGGGGNGAGDGAGADNVGSAMPGVMVGIVTSLQDPDKLGRVKVKLPMISDTEEADWMRIVQPGIGKDRGMYILPEPNDEVVVVFEHGDIRRGYVLGGVYNTKDQPTQKSAESAAPDAVEKRSFTSRKGHFMLFQDKDGDEFVQISTKDNKFSMKLDQDKKTILFESDSKVSITAKSDVEIKSDTKITLDAKSEVLIKSQKITIQASGGDLMMEGMNANLKGQTQLNLEGAMFDLKGSGKGSVNGGGMLEVKGGMVKIN